MVSLGCPVSVATFNSAARMLGENYLKAELEHAGQRCNCKKQTAADVLKLAALRCLPHSRSYAAAPSAEVDGVSPITALALLLTAFVNCTEAEGLAHALLELHLTREHAVHGSCRTCRSITYIDVYLLCTHAFSGFVVATEDKMHRMHNVRAYILLGVIVQRVNREAIDLLDHPS